MSQCALEETFIAFYVQLLEISLLSVCDLAISQNRDVQEMIFRNHSLDFLSKILVNYLRKIFSVIRGSSPELFLGKGVLKICSKFTGEHTCRGVISIKLISPIMQRHV